MRFTYRYKTSDGVPHEGTHVARTREAVYDELRARGIRAFGVEPAPGLLNKLRGPLGWIVGAIVLISVLAALVVVLSARVVVDAKRAGESEASPDDFLSASMRRQVVGDSAVIEAGIRDGWASVFEDEGERFLASFAIPGVPAGQRATTEAEIEAALARKIEVSDSDSIEERQIKSMVEGMKAELRRYLEAGGTIKSYGERLVARQEQELAFHRHFKAEVDRAIEAGESEDEVQKVWEKGNAELRRMGIRLVPMPGGE